MEQRLTAAFILSLLAALWMPGAGGTTHPSILHADYKSTRATLASSGFQSN